MTKPARNSKKELLDFLSSYPDFHSFPRLLSKLNYDKKTLLSHLFELANDKKIMATLNDSAELYIRILPEIPVIKL